VSLEARYTDHAGHVATARKAAANADAQKSLLHKDADALIAAAEATAAWPHFFIRLHQYAIHRARNFTG
jgi:hypothetical protein